MRDLHNMNWEDWYDKYLDDIEKQWGLFTNKLCEAVAKFVPQICFENDKY